MHLIPCRCVIHNNSKLHPSRGHSLEHEKSDLSRSGPPIREGHVKASLTRSKWHLNHKSYRGWWSHLCFKHSTADSAATQQALGISFHGIVHEYARKLLSATFQPLSFCVCVFPALLTGQQLKILSKKLKKLVKVPYRAAQSQANAHIAQNLTWFIVMLLRCLQEEGNTQVGWKVISPESVVSMQVV